MTNTALKEVTMAFPNYNVTILRNPTQSELRGLTLQHTPYVKQTAHGNLDKISRNKSRMAAYTYVIATPEEAKQYSAKTIDPATAARLIDLQKNYIDQQQQLIAIEGYYGLGDNAVAVEWLYTPEAANIAGMQQVLAFPRSAVESAAQLAKPFVPQIRVVYTPGCPAADMPAGQAIFTDFATNTAYILGPDYFGESKKSVLRMICEMMYNRGGLVMHAGAKVVKMGTEEITVAIMGLSGTGKTTTTFSKQGDATHPIQDDMVTLWPKGGFTVTENGCFAKTAGLTPESEPVIYNGTIDPSAWVENVFVNQDGTYDFNKTVLSAAEVAQWKDVLIGTGAPQANVEQYIAGTVTAAEVIDDQGVTKDGWDFVSWTQNGRSIIPLDAIKDAADLTKPLPPVKSMGTLNRDEGRLAATPGIVRFTSPAQAAGFFMLGETTKTSAAGKDRGKTRSPFTQPFFARTHDLQATRFNELAATMPNCQMWMMNTGYIGGTQRDVDAGNALKVKIRHSSAMLEALFSGNVVWKVDPDFGYEIIDADAPANAALLEKVPADILEPKRYYAANGRSAEYTEWVAQMKQERREFLAQFNVGQDIIDATCGK